MALPLQDQILNPIPRHHLHLRRKVMSMHSLLISNFSSHKKVFFSARIRPTAARIGPIDQYIHKQAAAASSQAREERHSIHLTLIRRCLRDHRRLLRRDAKLLYSKRMVLTLVIDYVRPQSCRVHFNCNETLLILCAHVKTIEARPQRMDLTKVGECEGERER